MNFCAFRFYEPANDGHRIPSYSNVVFFHPIPFEAIKRVTVLRQLVGLISKC